MAASRTAPATSWTASGRLSFAKIREPLEVPDLLALQTESFDWLLGNERWQARVAAALESGRRDVPDRSGLEEIFEEISPIEDFSGSMSLSFRDHRFEESKYSIEDCKERDQTYSAPLFVTAEFMNNTTGEIKSQTVFMGDFPLMTERGTFIINGTERVVVSQLVRSPGVYFERTPDKTSDKDIFTSKIIPSRGAWLEFEIDKRDMIGVRVDRKRKQSVTVLLKALGWTEAQIREEFAGYESMELTLEKDHIAGQDDALLDIYRKLRPGEPPTREAAQTLLDNLYFNPKRYDLAKVGRYKIGRKLGKDVDLHDSVLTVDDIVATIKYLVALHNGDSTLPGVRDGEQIEISVETDDIDHFGNRRLRSVGELIQNQVRTGLSRMERVVRERMTTQDVEAITPQTLINIRPVVASIKEFFGTSQLSQFMDQNNPLAGLTHKRRLSALGPGGLSRDRAGMEVRDVHPSHYGRMCPIETPEGPNIGLIGSLASYGRINAFGFIETPYRSVTKGKVSDDIHYLSADEEDKYVIAHRAIDGEPVPGTFAAEDELFGIGAVLGELGTGVFELAPTGTAGEDLVAPMREVAWMRRLAETIDRPVTFALLQVDPAPDLWREVLDESARAAAEGVPLVPQVPGRPTGLLSGFETTFSFLDVVPAYQAVAHLPLAEKVALLRGGDTRRAVVGWEPDAETAARIRHAAEHTYLLGDPPNYEPGPDQSVAGVARASGRSEVETALDAMLADDGRGLLYLPIFNYSEGDAHANREMLLHPAAVLGLADGGAHVGTICDASMPTYMLTHWVRDRSRGERLPLEAVVAMQTRETAALYGLGDRGTLETGQVADLNVIDLENLRLEVPRVHADLPAGGKRLLQGARGYLATVKSGTVTFRHDTPTGEHPGRLVRGAR